MKFLSLLFFAILSVVVPLRANATSQFSGPVETRTIGGCTKPWNSSVYVLTAAVGDNTHYQSAKDGTGTNKLDSTLKFCVCSIRVVTASAADTNGIAFGYSTNATDNGTSAPTGYTQLNMGAGFLDGGNIGVEPGSVGATQFYNSEFEIPANKYITIATVAGGQGPRYVEILGEYKTSCH